VLQIWGFTEMETVHCSYHNVVSSRTKDGQFT